MDQHSPIDIRVSDIVSLKNDSARRLYVVIDNYETTDIWKYRHYIIAKTLDIVSLIVKDFCHLDLDLVFRP